MAWIVEPFLNILKGGLYNPIADQTMDLKDERFHLLSTWMKTRIWRAVSEGQASVSLIEDGWLVQDEPTVFRRFRLMYATVEGHSLCNQKCHFCPVSVEPRALEVMPMELFERIVSDLSRYKETLKGLFLFGYNEPTSDPFFLERLELLTNAGNKVAVNTNGTGLTPKVCNRIEELGGLEHLSINLSTLHRQRYRNERCVDQLELVLRNLEYAKRRPIAKRMVIAVLGGADKQHQNDVKSIMNKFERSRFEISKEVIMDRAGLLDVGAKLDQSLQELQGCNSMGSRPVQHLHVMPDGSCLLCCQDYFGELKLGNLRNQTIADVMGGEEAARLRRWVYGSEEAPHGFICRNCIYALGACGKG